jgi:hypothetical protein
VAAAAPAVTEAAVAPEVAVAEAVPVVVEAAAAPAVAVEGAAPVVAATVVPAETPEMAPG